MTRNIDNRIAELPSPIALRWLAREKRRREADHGSAVLALLRPSLPRGCPHLRAGRCRRAALLPSRHQLGWITGGHLRALRVDRRALFHEPAVLTRKLVDELARFAAYEVQRLEHRVPLFQPSPRMGLGRSEQSPNLSRDFFQTRRSSLCHADLQP